MNPSNQSLARGRQRHIASFNDYLPQRVEAEDVPEMVQDNPALRVVDEYDNMLEELFRIENPGLRPETTDYFKGLDDFRAAHYGGAPHTKAGSWFYYSWRSAVVHVLPRDLHYQVRTARNRNLITAAEQDKLRGNTIGVAGLSVGSNILNALVLMGQYKQLKIADADELSLSNMNRLQSDITQIGVPKTTLAARSIYERDPEADVVVFAEGVNEHNLDDFLDGTDIIVEEFDDVSMKARLRLAARERKLPVIMMTDSADSGILDIERYDLDPEQKLFHGRLSQAEINQLLSAKPNPQQWINMVAKIIGMEHVPARLKDSLRKIGTELQGAPQLGTAAMVSGGIGAYVARMIALGQPLKKGKIPLDVEATIING